MQRKYYISLILIVTAIFIINTEEIKATEYSTNYLYDSTVYDNTLAHNNELLSEEEMLDYLAKMETKIIELELVKNDYPDYKQFDERIEKAKEYYNTASLIYDTYNNLIFDLGLYSIYDILWKNQINYISDKKLYLSNYFITQYNNCQAISDKVDNFYGYYDIENERKDFINNALSLEGKINYVWGGKPTHPGFEEDWSKKGGLDCSGFVGWVYWTTFNTENEQYMSTLNITHSLEKINYEELKPGDLGTLIPDGSYYLDANNKKFYSYDAAKNSNMRIAKNRNTKVKKVRARTSHVGIYVGKDKDGNDLWVHCSGKANTVVIDSGCFNYYYRTEIIKE